MSVNFLSKTFFFIAAVANPRLKYTFSFYCEYETISRYHWMKHIFLLKVFFLEKKYIKVLTILAQCRKNVQEKRSIDLLVKFILVL